MMENNQKDILPADFDLEGREKDRDPRGKKKRKSAHVWGGK